VAKPVYSTSVFAPTYHSAQMVEFHNSLRYVDRVICAGYYPSGLILERIFSELETLPLKEEVWPKSVHHNALDVLSITETKEGI